MNDSSKCRWFSGLFSGGADFYELLNNQAAKTQEGIETLHKWFAIGQDEYGCKVVELEKEADNLKLALGSQLVESFITPFDREDINDLSNSMDEIINGAKTTVREIEAVEISLEDKFLLIMAEILVEGVRCVRLSIKALKADKQEARAQATLARKSDSRFSKVYRQAMQQLFELNDFKEILKKREVYRCLVHTSGKIDLVAEKLLHAIIKMT